MFQQQVIDALSATPAITDVVETRIFPRPLKRSGNNSTPSAYDARSIVRPSLVVIDEGGSAKPGTDDAELAYVVVWVYGPDTAAARTLLRGLAPEIKRVVLNTYLVGYGDTGTETTFMDQFGLRDDPADPDQVVDYLRFAVDHLGVTVNG